MNYWLSRNGGDAEGPFAESQLVTMWGHGAFTARDRLCAEDDETWLAAADVMEALPLPGRALLPATPPALPPRFAQRVCVETHGCLQPALLLFGILGLFFYIIPGLVLFALAAMLHSLKCHCSACGNGVSATSMLCPGCGAILGQRPLPQVVAAKPKRPLKPRKPNRFLAWFTKVK